MNKFKWLKSFFSPFKRPKIKLYIGKTAVGTPHFLPRKWVKIPKEEVIKQAKEKYDKCPKEYQTLHHYNSLLNYYKGMEQPISKKIGFDFVGLGWKTKFGYYRHQWNPVWSFVFFGWQIAIQFIPIHDMHYWEAWLYYELDTDKDANKMERIDMCLKKAPQIWTTYNKDGSKTTTNYYTKILKKKYLKLIKSE